MKWINNTALRSSFHGYENQLSAAKKMERCETDIKLNSPVQNTISKSLLENDSATVLGSLS